MLLANQEQWLKSLVVNFCSNMQFFRYEYRISVILDIVLRILFGEEQTIKIRFNRVSNK